MADNRNLPQTLNRGAYRAAWRKLGQIQQPDRWLNSGINNPPMQFKADPMLSLGGGFRPAARKLPVATRFPSFTFSRLRPNRGGF